jgi:hypothetical protein
VRSFASWTFGWSNGLIWRIAPATAVANSQAPPLLPGRLGQELFHPQAEPVRIRRDQNLVAPIFPGPAEVESEVETGVVVVDPAGVERGLDAVEQPGEVDSHQGGGDESEVRQRGVAPADRRLAGEHGPEAPFLGQPLELRAGIGDRSELVAALPGTLPEEVEVRTRLERRPRLRGSDEQRPTEIDGLRQPPDRLRMRGVQHMEPISTERPAEDLRGQAGTTHPQQDGVVDVGGDAGRELRELVEALAHPERLVQPPEPLRFVVAGPDGGVALPDALDQLVRSEIRRRQARRAWRESHPVARRRSRRTSGRLPPRAPG